MRFRKLTSIRCPTRRWAAALLMTIVGAAAADDAKYPDLKGQWRRATNAGAPPCRRRPASFAGTTASLPNPSSLSLGQEPRR